MSEPVNVPMLLRLAEAWQEEVTTPGDYSTDAFHALEDVLMGSAGTVVALMSAVVAANRYCDTLGSGDDAEMRDYNALVDALAPLDFSVSS